jgi:mannose-6-phosphate isomerase-like protein (cupin superfamily)
MLLSRLTQSGWATLAPWRVESKTTTCVRALTNATKPGHISSLISTNKGPLKPGGWHPTTIHSSSLLTWTVIRLAPGGGQVPAHHHTKVWDYFVPLAGKAIIETSETQYEMCPDSFLAVPPGHIHRVKNASADKEFVFLVAQTPRREYDYIEPGKKAREWGKW